MEAAFSAVYSSSDKYQPEEVAGDVIPGDAAEQISMDVSTKFGDTMCNCSQDIRAVHFSMDERRWKTTATTYYRSNTRMPYK